VTLTSRDKKLLIAVIPLIVLVGYWFLLLAPKRQEAGKLGSELAKHERRLDDVRSQVKQLESAKDGFAGEYATLVKLGKAIPTTVDMPGLIVQLDGAAHGTGIQFERIHSSGRIPASGGAPASGSGSAQGGSGSSAAGTSSNQGSGSSSGGSGTPAAAPGGAPAATGYGKAAEKAGEGKDNANQSASGADAASSSAPSQPQQGSATSGAQGLDAVPLEFTFRGGFFDLADFFHRLKRFVRVMDGRVSVRGRLMTVTGFELKAQDFPSIEAKVNAVVYLTPKEQGATAGATPSGPAPAAAAQQAAPDSSPSPSPPAATATAP
jgi:hypothetical protein